jgi:hypothetical protein
MVKICKPPLGTHRLRCIVPGQGASLLHPIKSNPMINNPIVNRLAVIVLMFAVYAAGISNGREQTVLTAQGTPVCQQVLKP